MEQPPSPFKITPLPTPLQQLSPDRVNQQRIPASPSVPNQLSNADPKLPRQFIDVQSKVAFINSLNQAGSPSRQQGVSTHAALQRALVGREEAESALRTSNAQLAEAELRQRKIMGTLEGLEKELHSVRERQAHERQVFEKEVRKAKKEAFRAGSALVKLQEDLKGSRAETRNAKAEAQHEKFEKEKSKQEAFERAYTLAGLLEEMETMREKMRAMEAAHEANLKERQLSELHEQNRLLAERGHPEEVEHSASLSSKGRHVQTTTHQEDHIRQNRFERILPAQLYGPEPEIALTKISQPEVLGESTPEPPPESETDVQEQLLVVAAELDWEKKLRARAEDMVHFLQMECQFKICACRVAEKNGKTFIYDKQYQEFSPARSSQGNGDGRDIQCQDNDSYEPSASLEEEDMDGMEEALSEREEHQMPPNRVLTATTTNDFHASSASGLSLASARFGSSQIRVVDSSSVDNTLSPATFSAEDMTYQSPIRTMIRAKSASSIPPRDSLVSPPGRSPYASPYPSMPALRTPRPQSLRMVHAHTTTTMVPLRDDGDVFRPAPGTPGTPVSREAALAQIRARRDRARSVAISSGKSAPGSVRRDLTANLTDVSAPGKF